MSEMSMRDRCAYVTKRMMIDESLSEVADAVVVVCSLRQYED
jgi:hypothetical protein